MGYNESELMDSPFIEVGGQTRLMAYLSERNIEYVKLEVKAMTREQAQRIWTEIEPVFNGVCYRAGTGGSRVKMLWTALMRKMVLIENKAKEEN